MRDLFAANAPPMNNTIGHGNAQFLADILIPGMTKAEMRNRVKQGRYPDLWKGAGQWIEFRNVR